MTTTRDFLCYLDFNLKSFDIDKWRLEKIATTHFLMTLLQSMRGSFRDLTLSEDVLASEEKFVSTVMELLQNPMSEKREGHVGPFYEVSVTAKSRKLNIN